jgi:hypothetical protein
VAESGFCPTCSSPILPGQAFCATCGTALSGEASRSGSAGTDATASESVKGTTRAKARAANPAPGKSRAAAPKGAAAKPAPAKAAAEVAPLATAPLATAPLATAPDPRLHALGLSGTAVPEVQVTPAPPAPAAPIQPGPAQQDRQFGSMLPRFGPPPAAQFAKPLPLPPAAPGPLPDDEPEPPARIPGSYVPPAEAFAQSTWALRPSSAGSVRQPGSSLSVSIGAKPVSNLATASPAPDAIEPQAAPAMPAFASAAIPAPMPVSAPLAAPFEAVARPLAPTLPAVQYQPSGTLPAPAATSPVAAPPSVPAPIAASSKPARKESTAELIAFGLVAAGAVIGMVSLFLPWAGLNGIGVGTTGSTPPANQSGWGMPAAWFFFLLSGLVLGAASGNDRAQERLPQLAPVIVKVTDVIMPMILGGLYLGVFLLYFTLPWGYGAGMFALLVAAALLISGAVVTLFFPPEARTEAGADPG